MAVFSLAVLFITIVLYLPGFLIARFFYRDNMVAIAVAPLPSFALYAILGIFFNCIGLGAKWWMLVIAATVISAVIYHFRNAAAGPKRMSIASGIDWKTVVPYVVFGVVITGFFFCGVAKRFFVFCPVV